MANFTNADVMALRQKTGVGMMDCKKALVETNGNIDEAIKYLREKGMATASKKADRIAAEGIVDSYIHMGGKIGVLIEVNCETDFVARSEQFVELVHNLCMQIAAAKPLYVRKEDVEAEKLAEEREILLAQAKNEPNPKPAAVIEKMVEGRINKYYKEVCLLEQDYVKDSSKTVTALINEAVAAIGEKITVRRFVRRRGNRRCYRRRKFLERQTGHEYGQVYRRPYGYACDGDKRACSSRRSRTERGADKGADGAYNHARGGALYSPQGAATSGKGQSCHFRLRHRQSLLFHRYDGRSARGGNSCRNSALRQKYRRHL